MHLSTVLSNVMFEAVYINYAILCLQRNIVEFQIIEYINYSCNIEYL